MKERPSSAWEGVGAAELARRWGAPAVHLFSTLGSTNDVARRLAAAGAPAGTVVLAEEQLAGRGRAGRSWASPAGLGLWISAVFPASTPASALLPLQVGLAVAQALDPFLPSPGVGIKWPNDLWIGARKLGGILCEATWEGGRTSVLVAGVGLNLLHSAQSFPAEIREQATSLQIAAGCPVARLDVADRVVPHVLAVARHAYQFDAAALAARDLLRGARVAVSEPMSGRTIATGTADGIESDGALAVRDSSGTVHRITSGTVRVQT